ncbi:hypothetical protein PY479_16865 [Shewanella sp. A32]|uniref:hypothetical protein n=1 Tax=Shewanella sp. A32 TaxID=3031327 RepID=UPI0023B9C395|nr:hypothetical protein [Shewanella sp. A32]MDF0535942.1 hypothetical protein [Shewanella sp. A32]
MRKTLWISAMLFFVPNLSMAEDEPSLLMEGGLASLIAFRDSFTIEYSDQVSDGCLPQPSRMKDKMELAIRQNGFSISTESILANKIKVTAMGFSTNASSCVISLQAELEFWANVVVPFSQTVPTGSNTLAPITYDFGTVILTGNKNGMQERVENQVKEFGDDLYLRISRAKDYISKKFPQIPQYHEQQKSDK